MNQKLLRQIPKVDELMKQPMLLTLCETVPSQTVTQAVRQVLEDLRKEILPERWRKCPLWMPCAPVSWPMPTDRPNPL